MEIVESADLDPVSSRGEAREAFAVVGWTQAMSEIGADDLRSLRQLEEELQPIEETLAQVDARLADIEKLIAEMKDTGLLGNSVWDIATDASPGLSRVDDGIDELRSNVAEWGQSVRSVGSNAADAADRLEAATDGPVTDYDALAQQIDESTAALSDLVDRSSRIRDRLSTYAEVSARVADVADELGPLGDRVSTVFGKAADLFARVASSIGEAVSTLESHRTMLASIRQSAGQTRSSLLEEAEQLAG